MDGTYSSGEEHILKARKPYTITKQRERWTEEEHNRFLEALKLFGRAWQRIEEHIGTKTAVQIRSHAQKFFTKLEKEANVKGIPLGQALDIEIPPPRPKRKPSIPYPRKLINGGPIPQVGSGNVISGTSLHSVPLTEDALDLEREPPPEIPSTERFGTEEENHEDVMHVSGTRKPCAFKRFVPNLEEELNSDEVNESYVTVKTKDKQNLHKVDTKLSFQESGCTEKHDILGERDGSNAIHVPVHVVDASMEIDTPRVSPHAEYHHDSIMHPSDKAHPKPLTDHSSSLNPNMAYHESVIRALDEANPKPFMDNSSSAKSNITYDVPFHGFHPNLTPIQNQDAYQSFIQASHTFSNLIVSNLLQNPAAHAAASYAASFWPSCASACNTGGFPVGSNNAPPSIEAIAAATVASATAWWAANGLFPLYPPFHMGFGYGPSSTYQVPMTKVPDPEFSEARREHHSLKYPALSSPETEQNKVLKNSKELNLNETEQGGGLDTELVEINKPLGVKQVDRSSCGSNETSSSEVDTDGLKQNKEELGVHDANGRRARSSGYASDSWKEVSEEGRLAFSALFSRMTLPQSFSPTYKGKNVIDINHQNSDAIDVDGKVQFDCSSYRNDEMLSYRNDGMLSYRNDGILINEKVKGRRTGFKPYKRCSLEAKEGSRGLLCVNNSSQDQEKGPNKRICLEGQSLL